MIAMEEQLHLVAQLIESSIAEVAGSPINNVQNRGVPCG